MSATAKHAAKNHEEWREKVRRYVRAGDRGEEPVFVGRESLFEKVIDMGAAAAEGQTDSRTIVVAGAPGAGKTAFMRELKKRWNEGRLGLAVSLRPGGLTPAMLFEKIAEAVDEPVQETREDTTTTKGGVSGGVKLERERSHRVVRPGDMERVLRSDEVPWSLIRERFGEHLNADSPLLLLCDEAQNMDDESKPLRTFLDSLHSGDDGPSPIPLVPVLAGLSDTTSKIVECGVSRPTDENDVSMGALSEKETEEYALKTLVHLDADATQGELAAWAGWFVDDCHGWPQHLRTQMTAVAKAMLDADTSRLRDLDARVIADAASDARNRYYRLRLAATGHNGNRSLVGEIAHAAGRDGVEEEHLVAEAARLARAYNERTADAEVSGKDIVSKCIHAGVFQTTPKGLYACPIPSMRRYLVSGEDHVVPLPPVHSQELAR